MFPSIPDQQFLFFRCEYLHPLIDIHVILNANIYVFELPFIFIPQLIIINVWKYSYFVNIFHE